MKYFKHLFDSTAVALADIFEDERYADKVIEYYFRNHRKWGKRDRNFFAEMVYECVRWWSQYEYASGAGPNDHPEDRAHKVMAMHLLVTDRPWPEWYEGIFDREEAIGRRESLPSPELKYAVPQWLYRRGCDELGENLWQKCLAELNKPAEVILRTNSLKCDVQALSSLLAVEEVEVSPLDKTLFPDALKLNKRSNVFRTEAFKKGLFEVQDASSQRVGYFLNPKPGERIVDACAGAGGKSLHLASLMENKGKIIAMDIHGWKLDELKKRARRDGISVIEPRRIDSTKILKRLKGSADALLLDVPCSGVGVLKRNPDSKWKMSEERLSELSTLQYEILSGYHKMVKPGGRLVYSTCSIFPSENEKQVERFVKEFPEWSLIEQKTLLPFEHGYDGFFMAKLEHKPQ